MKTASLHPGVVDTNFGQGTSMFKCFKCLCCCIIIDQEEGARTSLYLSRTPFGEIRSGEYYDADTRLKEMDRRGRNIEDVNTLWKMSEKVYGITFKWVMSLDKYMISPIIRLDWIKYKVVRCCGHFYNHTKNHSPQPTTTSSLTRPSIPT